MAFGVGGLHSKNGFARNLSPDQISVEVLRGKGELRNIVLNEEVLSEKLELPPWLRIRHASCNRVTVNIPWTSLKSSPVELYVDEIRVLLELCADDGSEQQKKNQGRVANSYGFGDRVVEGMSLYVNNVEIEFTSDRFRGSVMLSRLEVVSQTPNWKKAPDLKHTRFHDHQTNKVMFFKHISWQLLRVEARAIEPKNDEHQGSFRAVNSPLRLITSAGRCRVVIKKSGLDGSLICGRMQTILEEVLWVATLPQLRSAILFAKHIVDLIQKSQEALKKQSETAPKSINSAKTVIEQNREMSARFKTIDFNQSSNHVYINRVDLHLCDDGTRDDFPHNWDINNGAIQVVLTRLSVDIYPSHSPLWKREEWVRYDASNSCANEAEKLVMSHLAQLSENMNEGDKRQFTQVCHDLRSQHVVVRVDDLLVNCVSQQTSKKDQVVPMVSSDLSARQTLPKQTPIFHLELCSYYYLNPTSFPVPPNATHLVIGPLITKVDPRSIRWLVYVSENISNVVDAKNLKTDDVPVDLRVEVLLPKVHFDLPVPDNDDRYPRSLSASICTITASNYYYEHTQLADAAAWRGFTEKTAEFVERMCPSLVEHVQNGQKLMRLDEQPDPKFLLVNVASLILHSEYDSNACQPAISNDFSVNVYLVEQPEGRVRIAVDPRDTIQLALDHFQFAQVIHVQGVLNQLMDTIKTDRQFFHKRYQHNDAPPKVDLYCGIERVILNLILPPISVPSPYDRRRDLPLSDTSESISSASTFSAAVAPNPPTPALPASPLRVPLLGALPDGGVHEQRPASEEGGRSEHTPSQLSSYLELGADVLEETASIVTSTSEDEIRFQTAYLETSAQLDDDVFKGQVTVQIAEDALFVEESMHVKEETNKHLSQVVNVFEIRLNDVQAVVGIGDDDLRVDGYVTSVELAERFKIRFGDVIVSKSTLKANSPVPECRLLDQTVAFALTAKDGFTSLNIKVRELDIVISDVILSHLGPFFQVDQPEDENFQLHLDLAESRIQIKDQRKKNPLRLTIGQLAIDDGATKPAQ